MVQYEQKDHSQNKSYISLGVVYENTVDSPLMSWSDPHVAYDISEIGLSTVGAAVLYGVDCGLDPGDNFINLFLRRMFTKARSFHKCKQLPSIVINGLALRSNRPKNGFACSQVSFIRKELVDLTTAIVIPFQTQDALNQLFLQVSGSQRAGG